MTTKLLFAITATLAASAHALEITSPDGNLKAAISVEDGRLGYTVTLNGQELVVWSPLGLETSVGDFRTGVKIVDEGSLETVKKSYDTPLGKQSHVDVDARQQTFQIENAAGQKLDVRFYVANDGVAFSYRIPKLEGEIEVLSEATSFAFPEKTRAILHPMAVAKTGWSRTQPSYEEYYVDAPTGEPSTMNQGWCLPALFKVADRGWVLIGETAVDPDYFGSRLAHESPHGVYKIDLPQKEEHLPESPTTATVAAGRWLPWRFLVVGESLAPIVASTLATDLVEPLYELDWQPRPGRVAWSWLPLKDANTIEPVQRKFIDMAAALGFEYTLIDADWDRQIGREKIEQLADYANDKGVRLLLWYNSNGEWNDAPYTPQDCMHTPEARAKEMAWLEKTGIAGIKVDFFGGDKQDVMALYDAILRDAAKHKLLVNFHGATIPRGWDRMYPNFATCEAVRGMEFCTFEQVNADQQAKHCTMLPFTRNVIGPMDFTPTMIGEKLAPFDNAPSRKTTLAFELALPILFHSPVQHFGLVPEDADRLPDFALDYLKGVPTTWDQTELLAGEPGKFVVLMRKKGNRQYIAAINGTDEPLTISIPSKHAEGASAIVDDGNGGLQEQELAPDDDGKLPLALLPRGGAVIVAQ
jgi:kynurenine formamidase